MENNTTKKEIVVKAVGDVLYIGLRIGTIVVMWKCIGRVNGAQINWIVKLIATYPMWDRVIDNGFKAWKRGKTLKKRISEYRKKRIEEDAERVNELVKDSRSYTDTEVEKAFEEAKKEFENLGFDINKYQDEIRENVKEILEESEESAS